MKIGIVGIGTMGRGIAANIVNMDIRMSVRHPVNQPFQDLVAAARPRQTVCAALAAAVDVVLLFVTARRKSRTSSIARTNYSKASSPGDRHRLFDSDPILTLGIARWVEKAGGRFLDAPMTRTPKEAAEGRLNLIADRSKELFGVCRPVLECYSENITFAGPVGWGIASNCLN